MTKDTPIQLAQFGGFDPLGAARRAVEGIANSELNKGINKGLEKGKAYLSGGAEIQVGQASDNAKKMEELVQQAGFQKLDNSAPDGIFSKEEAWALNGFIQSLPEGDDKQKETKKKLKEQVTIHVSPSKDDPRRNDPTRITFTKESLEILNTMASPATPGSGGAARERE